MLTKIGTLTVEVENIFLCSYCRKWRNVKKDGCISNPETEEDFCNECAGKLEAKYNIAYETWKENQLEE